MAYGTSVQQCAHQKPLNRPCNLCRAWTAAGSPMCAWYAACSRPADGQVRHPILGTVPTCTPCADKHALTLEALPPLPVS